MTNDMILWYSMTWYGMEWYDMIYAIWYSNLRPLTWYAVTVVKDDMI